MIYLQCFVILAVMGSTLAYTTDISEDADSDNFLRNIQLYTGTKLDVAGQFVPKSYYVIDHNGHKSDVIYLRNKRENNFSPLPRERRSQSSSSSGAQSFASSSAFAGSGNNGFGTGGLMFPPGFPFPRMLFDEDPSLYPGNIESFAKQFGGGAGAGSSQGSKASSSSGGSGNVGGSSDKILRDKIDTTGYNRPVFIRRSGEGVASGIEASSQSAGPHFSHSMSSVSVDSNGKVKYSQSSGQF